MKLTTEEIAWKYRVVRVADGASDELAQREFCGWLSELIRKEREESWNEGRNSADVEYEHIFNGHPVPEGELCRDCEQMSKNPYRKE